MDEYCDRQGCLEIGVQEHTVKVGEAKIPYKINVCGKHVTWPYDFALPGVYWLW
jgi:hypothetical protein